jgi:four helix bundle protein
MEKIYSYSFENLQAWKEAREMVKMTYSITLKFPNAEIYGITNQMRRAAVSVTSNISEGSGRSSKKDQAHFYQIAYSSLLELVNQFYTSYDLNYISQDQLQTMIKMINNVSFKINQLRKATLNEI